MDLVTPEYKRAPLVPSFTSTGFSERSSGFLDVSLPEFRSTPPRGAGLSALLSTFAAHRAVKRS
jgi:hypothetical protein